MGSRAKKAFQTTFGSDPDEKESGQDSTSKNGNVFEDASIKILIWSFYSNRQSEFLKRYFQKALFLPALKWSSEIQVEQKLCQEISL